LVRLDEIVVVVNVLSDRGRHLDFRIFCIPFAEEDLLVEFFLLLLVGCSLLSLCVFCLCISKTFLFFSFMFLK
jgi:hypothetical protein